MQVKRCVCGEGEKGSRRKVEKVCKGQVQQEAEVSERNQPKPNKPRTMKKPNNKEGKE